MPKILFLLPYPQNYAPSQRLKFEQYLDIFEKNGFDYEIEPFIDEKFWKILYKKGNLHLKVYFTIISYFKRYLLLFRLNQYDIVYCHLWITPHGFPLYEFLTLKFAKKIIFDIDDLIFLGHSSNANKIFQFTKGRKKPIFLMKKADHVITCTPYLDSFVRKYNINTTDISSTVNTNNYLPVNNYSNDHDLIIGWSGSHSTSKYIYLLEDVLKSISNKYKIKIHVLGDESFQIDGLSNLRSMAWSEETEIQEMQRFDIGIYPLPDEEWVLGKSGLKAIQYMALGIPTVATAIGANYRVIDDGVSGSLVKTNQEWERAIIAYIEDPELRRRHGLAARKKIEEYYSIDANAAKYLGILNSVST
jgi:glycosyltransferase involved in cell wall biosynthesis